MKGKEKGKTSGTRKRSWSPRKRSRSPHKGKAVTSETTKAVEEDDSDVSEKTDTRKSKGIQVAMVIPRGDYLEGGLTNK